MPHPLDSARERLKRAKENIETLAGEIDEFLAPVPATTLDVDVAARKPIITDENRKAFDELREFLTTQTVSPRFSVLAGEIIHHMRSSFDHLTWQLSSVVFQASPAASKIEFPVFKKRPKLCGLTKDKMCGYCRKIEGIASPTALTRIEGLQPHIRANPSRDPLLLIHDMDRFDKHRELVLAVYIMSVNILGKAQFPGVGQQMPWETKPRNVRATGPATNVEMKCKMSAQITFREFSGRDDKPLIPTLHNFLRFTTDAVESFAVEFP